MGVSITAIALAMMSWLADSYHLNISLLFISDINIFSCGIFSCLLIIVTANFLWNNFNAFSTDSALNNVGKVNFFDYFDGQRNRGALSFNHGSTHLNSFNNIKGRTVMFGMFVSISTMSTISMTKRRRGRM